MEEDLKKTIVREWKLFAQDKNQWKRVVREEAHNSPS